MAASKTNSVLHELHTLAVQVPDSGVAHAGIQGLQFLQVEARDWYYELREPWAWKWYVQMLFCMLAVVRRLTEPLLTSHSQLAGPRRSKDSGCDPIVYHSK